MEIKSKRGFASMDSFKRSFIAAQGGRAAHEAGVAHQFTSEEAREAGRKGGKTTSKNIEHMRVIGKIGGSMKNKK